jgi:hypothetical protein
VTLTYTVHPTQLGSYICDGDGCRATTIDRAGHSEWHARLEGRLADLELRAQLGPFAAALASPSVPLPAGDDRGGGSPTP